MDTNNKNNNIFGEISLFTSKTPATQGAKTVDVPQKLTYKKQKYINAFDSDLILENIDKKTKNKAVKINLKINAIERTLTKVNEELSVLQLLNLQKDAKRQEELVQLKEFLEYKLRKFNRERNRFGIIYSLLAFFEDKFDFTSLNTYKNKLVAEIKKYDKIAMSYIKSKNSDLMLFK